MAVRPVREVAAAVRYPNMSISFIVPVLNEEAVIVPTLTGLRHFADALAGEIILVDGGSEDSTLTLAEPFTDKLIQSVQGRALQMNAGAAQAKGEWLFFLHADSQLPRHFETIWQEEVLPTRRVWGRFDVRLSGSHPLLRLVERMMNLRSRLTGIATGDQAIFVRREVFQQLGGYAQIPLMEDIEISQRLRRKSPPLCLDSPLVTSSRHWEQRGILRTILLMWKLRLLFFAGVSPERLVQQYYRPVGRPRPSV